MAEGFFRKRLSEKLLCPVDQLDEKGYKALSAGVMACNGTPASPEAIMACREKGIDISGHQARLLTDNLLNEADYIFVMDTSHYAAVQRLSQQAISRTALLAIDREIDDPIGMPLDTYRRCLEQIACGVDEQLDKQMSAWNY